MTKTKLILCFLFSLMKVNAQEKVYFGRAHNYSTVYSYAVTEIIISPDSILTRLDYRLANKNEWKKYKTHKAEKKIMRISRRGKYYLLIDPESGVENEMHCIKITDKKLTYFFLESEENLVRGYTFKRIN